MRLSLAVCCLAIATECIAGEIAPTNAEATAGFHALQCGGTYTSVNDLPSMVAGLAEATGGRKIKADRHLVGGGALEKHVKDQKAIDNIHDALHRPDTTTLSQGDSAHESASPTRFHYDSVASAAVRRPCP